MEKFNQKTILVTGGSGLLGSEIKKLLPQSQYPTSSQFNVESLEQMRKFLKTKKINLIIHAAAATTTHAIEANPLPALNINIIGTANLVKLCLELNTKLLYLSTDYVFDGKKGNYKENDAVFPLSKYAWSKLGGESAVRLMQNYIIVRTSFGPRKFAYDSAFENQWTSRERVDVIAKKIINLIKRQPKFRGVINIGGPRRSIYNYAKNLNPQRKIKKTKFKEQNKGAMARPRDASLNTTLYKLLMVKKS